MSLLGNLRRCIIVSEIEERKKPDIEIGGYFPILKSIHVVNGANIYLEAGEYLK